MSLDLFTLFPLLPSEIRLYIWELSSYIPHTLELQCSTPRTSSTAPYWSSPTPSPALLHSNSESRCVALSIYTLLPFSTAQLGVPWPRNLYINFACDTLALDYDLHSRYARGLLQDNETVSRNLRRLVLRKGLWVQLNEVALTPGPALDPRWDSVGYALESFPVAVAADLKELVDVRFHDR